MKTVFPVYRVTHRGNDVLICVCQTEKEAKQLIKAFSSLSNSYYYWESDRDIKA